jgi:hypothetical protein
MRFESILVLATLVHGKNVRIHEDYHKPRDYKFVLGDNFEPMI